MGREMRMPNRMEHRLPMQGCQENMRLVPENRMSERRLQSVQNQQCNKSRYIADVYELGFVMVETALYLDTHPDDGGGRFFERPPPCLNMNSYRGLSSYFWMISVNFGQDS
jgi:hypothetical protein